MFNNAVDLLYIKWENCKAKPRVQVKVVAINAAWAKCPVRITLLLTTTGEIIDFRQFDRDLTSVAHGYTCSVIKVLLFDSCSLLQSMAKPRKLIKEQVHKFVVSMFNNNIVNRLQKGLYP